MTSPAHGAPRGVSLRSRRMRVAMSAAAGRTSYRVTGVCMAAGSALQWRHGSVTLDVITRRHKYDGPGPCHTGAFSMGSIHEDDARLPTDIQLLNRTDCRLRLQLKICVAIEIDLHCDELTWDKCSYCFLWRLHNNCYWSHSCPQVNRSTFSWIQSIVLLKLWRYSLQPVYVADSNVQNYSQQIVWYIFAI